MAHRFKVATPDDLCSLLDYVIDGTNPIKNLARVWIVTKKQGKEGFDGHVHVLFSTRKKESREAVIYRDSPEMKIIEVATLKYNLALRWCMTHLREE